MNVPEVVVSVLITLAASSGFWGYLGVRKKNKNAVERLIMGLAYDRLSDFAMKYIARGYVTVDELNDLRKYFYEPYIELGGNGVAEKMMGDVMRLPIVNDTYHYHKGLHNGQTTGSPTQSEH